MPSFRVEQALEQLSEDGALTGDLDDESGGALLRWAEQQIIAADAIDDDAVFAERVAAVRSATRSASRSASRSMDAMSSETILAQATALLNGANAHTSPSALNSAGTTNTPADAASPAPEPHSATSNSSQSASTLVSKQPSRWDSLRRRIDRWIHLKV